ncbi:MAG: hypothetical protein HY787_24535 [Deltaproteobacteria bacterium]|nr:hypothetical protein [Deltaproteobacteria bacterium]
MKFVNIPTIVPGALERLTSYEWPGNVRELENVIERELILNREGPLTFIEIESSKPEDKVDIISQVQIKSLDLNRIMKEIFEKALSASGGKVEGGQGAAKLLSLHPWVLRHRMKKLGIPFGRKAKKIDGSRYDNY